MKQVFKIDSDGFYLEPVILSDNEAIPSDCVEEFPTEGMFKHKWNGTVWEEGLSQEEIDAIKNAPVPKTEAQILGEQLVAKDIEIMQLNDKLGQQIVGLDIRLMMGGM